MRRRLILILALILASFLTKVSYSSAEERITLTTYFPAPYGTYREIRTNGLAVGSAYRSNPATITDGYILASGRVGIGTRNPAQGLHLAGAASPGMLGRIRVSSADRNSGIEFVGGSGGTAVIYKQHNQGHIRFWLNGANRMTFFNTGNVSVGGNISSSTLSLSGGYPHITIGGSGRPGIRMGSSNIQGGNNFTINTNSNQFNFGANLAVGGGSGDQRLDVYGRVKIRGGNPGAGKVLTSADGTGAANWQTPGYVPAGLCTIAFGGCPSGWASNQQGDRFLRSGGTPGTTGGNSSHSHATNQNPWTTGGDNTCCAGDQANASGGHRHRVPSGITTNSQDHIPPFVRVRLCCKN